MQLRCQKRSSLPNSCCSKTQQWGAGAKTTSGTTAKSNSSSLDDPDNSSSAYNTGGSCNSNTLTLELNVDDSRTILASDRNTICRSTLVLYPPATPDRKPRQSQPISNASPPTVDCHIKSNQRQIKSPKHSKQTVLSPSNQRAATGNRIHRSVAFVRAPATFLFRDTFPSGQSKFVCGACRNDKCQKDGESQKGTVSYVLTSRTQY